VTRLSTQIQPTDRLVTRDVHATSKKRPSSHGARDLGGVIPVAARRLVLDFQPPWDYTPAAGVGTRLTIELATGAVTAARA
jgi:hypothetical protein